MVHVWAFAEGFPHSLDLRTMTAFEWHPVDDGQTIGAGGSEGTILLDEEHPLGSRITLEADCVSTPFAITCGIFGSMVHTVFAGDVREGRAKYKAMKVALVALMRTEDESQYLDGLSRFTTEF